MVENDKELEIPSWQTKLNNMRQEKGMKDIAYDDDRDYVIKEQEIALKHPKKGSIVKLTDEGYVDIFAGKNLGIRLDPHTNSINLFGDNINLLGKQFNVMTKSNGFNWNGYYFNPELYYENTTERNQVLTGTKEYYHMTHESDPELRSVRWHTDSWSLKPMVKDSSKRQYSEGMIQIMSDLGLNIG